MWNVEKNIKERHEMQEKTQGSQIKGKLQLSELNEAVEFVTKKFDWYEAERKRENYKRFTGESYRNVESIRDTEGITRPTAAVL